MLAQLTEMIRPYHIWAFVFGSTATIVAAYFAWKNYWRTHAAAAVSSLVTLIEKVDRVAVFGQAMQVNAACAVDPWAVLCAERERTSYLLTMLGHCARAVDDPAAWHVVLDGYEYGLCCKLEDRPC